MSPLQLGLLALGGAVLLVLLAYNLWLTHQSQRRQSASIQSVPDRFGQEPTLDAGALEGDLDGTDFALPLPEKKPGLDALIDVIALIALDSPVSGEALLAAMPPTRRVGSKPFAVEGMNITNGFWQAPQAGQRYSQLQAGLQLANRAGALNDIEFSEFVIKTQTICDALGGTPDFPEMRSEISRARELDLFASDHDAQLSFVLRARRATWSPSYIQQMVTKLGFVPGSIAGRMVVPASFAGSPPVLSLTFDAQAALAEDATLSALRELTISLDVPNVDRGERAFSRMCKAALSLAREMDGLVTDDNGVALPPEAMDVIAAELEQLYNTLDQRDISAGCLLARRLFS